MKKKLGVFLIRGAGKEGSKQQEKFVDKLNSLLHKSGVATEFIHYEYANWYLPTQSNEEKLYDRFINSGLKIKAKSLRRFVLFLISDLVAYIGEPNKPSTTYRQTHELIHKSILNLKDALEEGAPLIIIASSLSTEIISNYIWDRQHTEDPDPLGASPFERLETLTGIFMFGNNNPIFLSAYDIDNAKPFQFPSEKLPSDLKDAAYWGNFYDKNDPMGYPLKPVNPNYDSMVTEDVQVNSGGILLSWNAGSHLGYWKTKKIMRKVAGYIKLVLKAYSDDD